jgi:dinuclear metal center YbgI/SA1388 family protein
MGRVTEIKDILTFLERSFADITRQYDWDNSGKQLVLEDRKVEKAALALDPTEKVIEKAIEKGCGLLITHHPLFFGKTKSLDYSRPFDRKIIKAIKNNLSIIAAHTSLDLADYGLNDYICDILGAVNSGSFINEGAHEYVKFAVFVPASHAESVRTAMIDAGAGHIGNYSGCTFSTPGEGTFIPGDGTDPFIGERDKLEKVAELRIETIIDKRRLGQLKEAVIRAHPYEEVAHDVYKLDMGKQYGIGRVGTFKKLMPKAEFLNMVKEKLELDTLRINIQPEGSMTKFAVVTGSGASMWKACKGAGVDILLTGDMKHHDAIDAAENGVMIADAGHYETEKIYMTYLSEVIQKEFNIETVVIDEDPSVINWR